jgi:hypothetical protein
VATIILQPHGEWHDMNMARVRALAIVGTLAVAATVLVVVTMTKDTQTETEAGPKCAPGLVQVSLKLPSTETTIKIKVFNATNRVNVAGNVATDFKYRRFEVIETGNAPTAVPDEVAVLRYGPKAIANAHVLRAYFLNEADREFDIKREDDVVDVIIGGRYQQLATHTEFNQAIGALGRPAAPTGTCAVD